MLGLRLDHEAEVDVPMYEDPDLPRGRWQPGRQLCTLLPARLEDPERDRWWTRRPHSHLDPLLATPSDNAFLKTVAPWIGTAGLPAFAHHRGAHAEPEHLPGTSPGRYPSPRPVTEPLGEVLPGPVVPGRTPTSSLPDPLSRAGDEPPDGTGIDTRRQEQAAGRSARRSGIRRGHGEPGLQMHEPERLLAEEQVRGIGELQVDLARRCEVQVTMFSGRVTVWGVPSRSSGTGGGLVVEHGAGGVVDQLGEDGVFVFGREAVVGQRQLGVRQRLDGRGWVPDGMLTRVFAWVASMPSSPRCPAG